MTTFDPSALPEEDRLSIEGRDLSPTPPAPSRSVGRGRRSRNQIPGFNPATVGEDIAALGAAPTPPGSRLGSSLGVTAASGTPINLDPATSPFLTPSATLPPVLSNLPPDPLADAISSRYAVLALAYDPTLSATNARALGRRLYEWSANEPELQALLDQDFTAALTTARGDWHRTPASAAEQWFAELDNTLWTIRGYQDSRTRNAALDEAEAQARRGGRAGIVERLMAVATDRRIQYIVPGLARLNEMAQDTSPGAVVTSFAERAPTTAALLGVGLSATPLSDFGVELVAASGAAARDADTLAQHAAIETEIRANVTPEAATAAIARTLAEQNGVPLQASVFPAQQIWDSLDGADQEKLLRDIEEMSVEEVREALLEIGDPTPEGIRGVTNVLGGIGEAAKVWDGVAFTVAAEFGDMLANFENLAEHYDILADGDDFFAQERRAPHEILMTEGWDAFTADFEDLSENGLARTYYGMDGAAAAWFDLGAAVLFDPTNLIGGGKSAATRWARMMTTGDDGAQAFLSHPAGHRILSGLETGNIRQMLPAMDGLSLDARVQILRATRALDEVVAVADEVAVVADEVVVPGSILDEFTGTSTTLYHGTRTEFNAFGVAEEGQSIRQSSNAGGKYYFSEDPSIANNFATQQYGELATLLDQIGVRLDDFVDMSFNDVEALYESLDEGTRGFFDSSAVAIYRGTDDASPIVAEGWRDFHDKLAGLFDDGFGEDDLLVIPFGAGDTPRVVRTQVFGKELDLSAPVSSMDPEVQAALRADNLIDEGKDRVKGWQFVNRQTDAIVEWMRANGYGRARIRDAKVVSGETSIFALQEFIRNVGETAEDVARRVGIAVDDLVPAATPPTAATPPPTRETIADILRGEISNGAYTGPSSSLIRTHNAYLGVASLADRMVNSDSRIANWIGEHLTNLLIHTDHTSVVDLGEATIADSVSRLVLARYANDPDLLEGALTDFYRLASRWGGDRESVLAEMVAEIEELSSSLARLDIHTPRTVREVGKMRARLNNIDIESVNARAGVTEGAQEGQLTLTGLLDPEDTLQALLEESTNLRSIVDELGPAFDEFTSSRTALLRRLDRLKRSYASASRPQSRAPLQEWIQNFYEGWARELLGLDETVAITRDHWIQIRSLGNERVAGKVSRAFEAEDAGRRSVFGEYDEIFEGLGVAVDGPNYRLPASPYDMLMYGLYTRYRGTKDAPKLFGRIADAHLTRSILWALDKSRAVWALNLLINPLTATKAIAENSFRYASQAGDIGTALRGFLNIFNPNALDNPRALAAVEALFGGGAAGRRGGGWTFIEPAARGQARQVHFGAAKQFIEGTLMNDEAVVRFARAYMNNNPAEFIQWIETQGRARLTAAMQSVLDLAGRKGAGAVDEMSGASAYSWIERGLRMWSETSPKAETFFDDLMGVLAQGGREVPDAIARNAGVVPGIAPSRANWLAGTYEGLYGAPAQRQGALFYDRLYNRQVDVLRRRYRGRIVDTDDTLLQRIVDAGIARDLEDARLRLRFRDRRLDSWMRANGYVTDTWLQQVAHQHAVKELEGVMYATANASVAGRGVARVSPFAGAQMNFLGFYLRLLASGQNAATPVNLRLLSRYGHLLATNEREQNTDTEQAQVAGQNVPIPTPGQLLERYTFLPIDMADPSNFMFNVLPGFGPLPQWLIGATLYAPDRFSEDTIRTAEFYLPTLAFNPVTDVPADDLMRQLIPPTGRSLTGTAGWLLRGVSGNTGLDLNKLGVVGNFLDLAREPWGFNDFFKDELGNILANAETGDLLLTPSTQQRFAEAADRARRGANRTEAGSRLSLYFGGVSPLGSNNQLRHWTAFADAVPSLAASGLIGTAQADAILATWDKGIENLSPTEANLLSTNLSSALFDLDTEARDVLVAQNPELAIFLTSSAQCAIDENGQFLAGEYCRPDGRVNNQHPDLQGPRGQEIRDDLYNRGHIVARSPVDIAEDAFASVGESRRRIMDQIYGELIRTEDGRPKAVSDQLRESQAQARYRFTDEQAQFLESVGVSVGPSMTGVELQAAFDQARQSLPTRPRISVDNNTWKILSSRPEFAGVVEDYDAIAEDLRGIGITSEYEWPQEAKDFIRERFAQAAIVEPEILRTYAIDYSRAFGDMDFEAPTPPSLDELTNRIEVVPEPLAVDGDTFTFRVEGGDRVRVRIIGLNAPEQGQPGYWESTDQLDRLLSSGRTISIGIYEPDTFGILQDTDAEGGWRMYGWLYVDGQPLYDPTVFEAGNQRGARTGGEVVDLEALLAGERLVMETTP